MQNRIFFLTHAHSDSHTVYRDFLVSFVQFIRFSEMLVQWWISFKVISKLYVFSAFSMYFLFWMILNLKQIFFFSISFIRPSFVEDLCLKENRSYYLTLHGVICILYVFLWRFPRFVCSILSAWWNACWWISSMKIVANINWELRF